MDMYLKARTKVPDLVIDYIEVKLKDGTTQSLNWEKSEVTRVNDLIHAAYLNLYFGEEKVKVETKVLEGLQIVGLQTYSKSKDKENPAGDDVVIEEMEFYNDIDDRCVVKIL